MSKLFVALVLLSICGAGILWSWQVFSTGDRRFGASGPPWIYDEVLGWRLKPVYQGRFRSKEFFIDININSLGLRGKEYSIERTEKNRILLIGDSFGWGWGVEERQTFSEILESRYPKWEVINASVPGYGTDQQLLYLKEYGVYYNPDVLLLLFTQNDFRNNTFDEQYSYYKPVYRLDGSKLMLTGVPVPVSSLRQRFLRLLSQYASRARLFAWLSAFGHPSGRNNQVTLELLRSIHTLAAENSMVFVLVSVPMSGKDRGILQAFSENEGVPYLPLDDSFSSADNAVSFVHDGHWNGSGHRMAAEAIEQFFVDERIFDGYDSAQRLNNPLNGDPRNHAR